MTALSLAFSVSFSSTVLVNFGHPDDKKKKQTGLEMSNKEPQPQPSLPSRRTSESLGWLTESTLMPKKQKAIEGVGASSILDLKAHLYKSQEQARKDKSSNNSHEFHRAKPRPLPNDLFSIKNSGVETRAKKDKLELKAETDGSKSYAALEKKAELYEKLARGEVSDEEEKEKYCVDFFSKSTTQDNHKQIETQDTKDVQLNETEETDSNDLLDSRPFGFGRTGETVDRDEHKRFIREVHEEANQERQKITTAKLRRQEQEVARREKLKQAYLRKKLEKLMAAKNATNNGADADIASA